MVNISKETWIKAINFTLENALPGGDLVKIMLGTADAPQTVDEYLELAVSTVLDFIPGGKGFKLFKGTVTKLGVKKLKKQLLKQAEKRCGKAAADNIFKTKKKGLSGKEGAKNPPDWAKNYKPKVKESGKDFAKRVMDEKYGPKNYDTGTGTEFNQIKKWADRSFE